MLGQATTLNHQGLFPLHMWCSWSRPAPSVMVHCSSLLHVDTCFFVLFFFHLLFWAAFIKKDIKQHTNEIISITEPSWQLGRKGDLRSHISHGCGLCTHDWSPNQE